jgi:hypothetical protein
MKMNWESLRFQSYHGGNYGCGNFHKEDWILGAVLFRSPAIVIEDEQHQEDDWKKTTEGVWGIETPTGVIFAKWVCTEGKGGRGCDPYEHLEWSFHNLPEKLSVEAIKALAPRK